MFIAEIAGGNLAWLGDWSINLRKYECLMNKSSRVE